MRQVLVMVVALVSIFANAGATETNIRTYVLYWQGGPLNTEAPQVMDHWFGTFTFCAMVIGSRLSPGTAATLSTGKWPMHPR